MPKNIYILSDLHGHFNIFLKMLEKINFSDDDLLYILGDCCDRGPNSLDIYFYLQMHKHNMILLKGNHEIMMRDAFIQDDPQSVSGRQWSRNGGRKTIESYHKYLKKSVLNEHDYKIVKSAFYKMMIDYVNTCPSFVEVNCNGKDYVLIHAGINPDKSLYEQSEEECAWMREYFFMSKGLEDKTIIFGHTPTNYLHQQQSFDVWEDPIFHDKIGIDGGLGPFEDGQLNCLCLNTKEVFVLKKSEVEETA